jgi:hypothetical protein
MGMYIPPKEAMEVYPADADEGVTSVKKEPIFDARREARERKKLERRKRKFALGKK